MGGFLFCFVHHPKDRMRWLRDPPVISDALIGIACYTALYNHVSLMLSFFLFLFFFFFFSLFFFFFFFSFSFFLFRGCFSGDSEGGEKRALNRYMGEVIISLVNVSRIGNL